MSDKYIIDTNENRDFLSQNAQALLDFGRRFPSPGGGSYYLSDDGTPWKDRNRETWITCRMAHVYSIGAMMGDNGSATLAALAIKGLLGELKDDKNGGWYAGLTKDNEIIPDKQCYAHAFVILASTSALLAGIEGAGELLDEALKTYDKFFWDEKEGLAADTWNTEFTILDDYRGINANMHSVEAFLAVADCMDRLHDNHRAGDQYRIRAGRIIDHVTEWAKGNDHRIPEHFTVDWKPDLDKNREKPDDPFKPYGATPGHGIEWARLISQWTLSSGCPDRDKAGESLERGLNNDNRYYLEVACKLYDRAVRDAWNADGAEGIVYTTDWDGTPVVRDRMHWTLAEAINTSAVLYRITGNDRYADDYAVFMKYLDTAVLDKSSGSWFHQLDENNHLKGTVWPGKSDLYHAFQAMLIPYSDPGTSIAAAVYDQKERRQSS
ncbi:MAG: AGE family epimerase/isomerase [Lachnospiraceae bacterium]|nr:AGE family epimerase/isomerase [Lachnospiraceae bacterium]